MTSGPFQGTSDGIASPYLQAAVNVAVSLERPLLVRGGPGTGETLSASQRPVVIITTNAEKERLYSFLCR